MKYLLDTDHFSIWQYEQGAEFDQLARRLDALPSGDFGISIVTFHEQVLGANKYISLAKRPSEIAIAYSRLVRMLDDATSTTVLPLDDIAAQIADDLRRQRIRVSTMDLRIASIALKNNLTLLTRNTVDFERVPGLRIEDWTK
jgi:tRNA(fMet)-specific endonuclease VapC